MLYAVLGAGAPISEGLDEIFVCRDESGELRWFFSEEEAQEVAERLSREFPGAVYTVMKGTMVVTQRFRMVSTEEAVTHITVI